MIMAKTNCAFSVPELKVKVYERVKDHISEYAAKIMAILLASKWTKELKPMHTIRHSYSSAALSSLKHASLRCRHVIPYDILRFLYRIIKVGIDVMFVWAPAYIGIQGKRY